MCVLSVCMRPFSNLIIVLCSVDHNYHETLQRSIAKLAHEYIHDV